MAKPHDKNGVCARCNGTGNRKGYEHVDMGICFWCYGHKSVAKYKEIESKLFSQSKENHIHELKVEIARQYKAIQEDKVRFKEDSPMIKMRRTRANKLWGKLKEYGETMTLDEIVELSKGIVVYESRV